MKSCTDVEMYLDDYVDNALSDDMLKAVEAHITDCADCRAQVEALRDLLGQVHELPDSIEPARDLWDDVQARITAEPRNVIAFRPRLRSLGYAAAVAAMVVLAVGLGLQQSPAPERNVTAGVVASVDAIYAADRAALRLGFEERVARLNPEMQNVVAKNLAVIEEAMQEINDALASDPGNEDLEQMLHAAYQNEMSLLQQALRLAVET